MCWCGEKDHRSPKAVNSRRIQSGSDVNVINLDLVNPRITHRARRV